MRFREHEREPDDAEGGRKTPEADGANEGDDRWEDPEDEESPPPGVGPIDDVAESRDEQQKRLSHHVGVKVAVQIREEGELVYRSDHHAAGFPVEEIRRSERNRGRVHL